MSQGRLVLVTGVSGYLGSHIVDQLLKEGYRVRGTVRATKVAANKEAYSAYGDAVEIIGTDDLVAGSYPGAFKGVSAVIYNPPALAASGLAVEEVINGAIDGTLNIFRQAEKAGIKDFSFVSSIGAISLGFTGGDYSKLSEDQWLPLSKEELIKNKSSDPALVYVAEKVFAERTVWEFAEQNPHIEITTVCPPFFFGPFAPGNKAAYETATLTSMRHLYNLITPDGHPPLPYFVDVRDVARALVLGLKSPPTSQVGRKRILISSEWVQPADIIALITKERPALTDRLNEAFKKAPSGIQSVIDNRRAKVVLGIDVIPWEKTILDGVDELLKAEAEWKKRGIAPKF